VLRTNRVLDFFFERYGNCRTGRDSRHFRKTSRRVNISEGYIPVIHLCLRQRFQRFVISEIHTNVVSIITSRIGTAFNDLSHAYFPDGLFGNKDNSGFLFARPTLQCFNNLMVPSPPFLLAILIHKWEIPWAKVFPLRLLLRLGAEYKCIIRLN
jgi:hypothetical protein